MKNNFKDGYFKWLYDNTMQFNINDNISRLTLPYLDRNNDCTEIYVKSVGNDYIITDDGETLGELYLSNFNLFSSQKRESIFNQILLAHGISKSDNDELFASCSKDDLYQKVHMLTQCMIKVSDLFYTAKNTVQSLFIEDVQSYLDENDIRYSPNISFLGVSGLTTNYDFVIPKYKDVPERIIKVVNNIDQSQTNSILFLWNDTSQARAGYSSVLYVFLQDTDKKIPQSVITTMNNYNVIPVKWSKREDYINDLVK
ncbi:MAG: DUF1829 domain-containing protein [Suilimivivens sp.]